ncbi:hypothetical protein [Bifidobacterium olomucense]|uniref:Uncharacterized protein n=1 Tax=Bifidobacterium olomucense TaxID=2675324 RepID=A0A7Y0EZS3_9BIFI|nr:hypothetical protein [Bifidobacterium sp. DSM 109959]NMM99398.1 hypothetical protein [Bifidobacterium sp. DSM 109959]
MSTRIYCDQCGTETSERDALRFRLSGYSANRTTMGRIEEIGIDICPKCAASFNGTPIGRLDISRDLTLPGAPYKLEYQPQAQKGQTA